jgi:hypothetical protein
MYRLVITYEGYNEAFDNLIRKTVSSKEIGSGYGMGERDISFEFKTLKELIGAGRRVENNKKLKRKVEVLAYKDDNKVKLPR